MKKKKREKTIIDNVQKYILTGNKKQMLVAVNGDMAIINVKPDQKVEKKLILDEMETTIDLREEWQQIFNDAWRLERDFFYDKNMHGVNWQGKKL